MSIAVGRNCWIGHSASGGAGTTKIPNAVSASMEWSADSIEADHRDVTSGWKATTPGKRTGTATIELIRDWADTQHQAIMTAFLAGTKRDYRILDVISGDGYYFTGVITGVSCDEPLDGYAPMTVSIAIDGAPSEVDAA